MSDAEIKEAVDALIEKNKEALVAQRYCFPISQLMYAMKEGRMKWADGKKMREIFDAAILALLGPKTDADAEAMEAGKKKSKKDAKKKVDQNMSRSKQELDEIQKTIDSRVAAQNTSLKLEYDTAKSDMNTVTKRVPCGDVR